MILVEQSAELCIMPLPTHALVMKKKQRNLGSIRWILKAQILLLQDHVHPYSS